MPASLQPAAARSAPRSVGAGIVALGLLGGLAMAALLAGARSVVHEQQSAAERVEHAQELLLQAAKLELDIQTAVGEGRGFFISKDLGDRMRYEVAEGRILDDLGGLRRLAAANHDQQREIDQLQPMIAVLLAIWPRAAPRRQSRGGGRSWA